MRLRSSSGRFGLGLRVRKSPSMIWQNLASQWPSERM
uniref:Uncharacterized protein n=1 Tax=Myoviridae sp. ctCpP1 TaxID=2825054 RepID=A0A8S5V7F3_9CAUD|nr:MAG TPA: hypothetical protein [Myoviridae sp. ctCpP1]